MCIYSQTQYLACGHNIESLTKMCELGKEYKPSMHDKIIIGLHTSKDQCERCDPSLEAAHKATREVIDLTRSTPEPASSPEPAPTPEPATKPTTDFIDLTKDTDYSSKRRDSIGEDLMDTN